jgi:diguanylate cyclase (GGDEF)-like protein
MTMSVMGITLIVSVLDGRMQSRTSVLATSLAEANYELMQLALHDTLTRLPNRVLLEDRMKQALNAAQRNGTSFAVMFIDLDGFKAVNDAYGHQIGDKLLISVSSRLQGALRAQDTLARIGGDEFVVLANVGDATDASTLANKLAKCACELIKVDGHDLRVSASIGIVMYPGDGADERELMLHADAAMYHMKNSGRNGYSFFEASMNKDAQDHLMLMNDLRVAQERNEFFLDYQPKYRAPTGPISGFEALLRWQHPTRGLLGPDLFLLIAEKTGMIIPIGQWVLNEACRQLREWHDQGHKSWTVSVNLSACQFEQDDLVETVRKTIDLHGISPHSLTLEVTESIAMKDADASIATLNALTALGVKASIDDFGTGYSSLLYLKRLPASELKIDKAFVHELTPGSEDEVIVSAIVALAKALGLTVVAEGVETLEQQSFLTNIGCESLQGFLLDRPLAVETINDRIRSLALQTTNDLHRGFQQVLPFDAPNVCPIQAN